MRKTRLAKVGQSVEWVDAPEVFTRTQLFIMNLKKRPGVWAVFPYGTTTYDLWAIYGVDAMRRTLRQSNGRCMTATFVRWPESRKKHKSASILRRLEFQALLSEVSK